MWFAWFAWFAWIAFYPHPFFATPILSSRIKFRSPLFKREYLPFPPSYGVICVTNECKSSILEISLNDIKLILECISTEKFKISRVERRSTSIFFIKLFTDFCIIVYYIIHIFSKNIFFLNMYILHENYNFPTGIQLCETI